MNRPDHRTVSPSAFSAGDLSQALAKRRTSFEAFRLVDLSQVMASYAKSFEAFRAVDLSQVMENYAKTVEMLRQIPSVEATPVFPATGERAGIADEVTEFPPVDGSLRTARRLMTNAEKRRLRMASAEVVIAIVVYLHALYTKQFAWALLWLFGVLACMDGCRSALLDALDRIERDLRREE